MRRLSLKPNPRSVPPGERLFMSGGVNYGNHDDRFGVFFNRINNFVGKFVRIPPTNISARLLF
jgi:hypothetical protein